MDITRTYRKLENIEEVHMSDVSRKEYYKFIPREFDVEEIPFPELLSNIPLDIHILTPYRDGEDFIIRNVGNITIREGKFSQDDVTGRLLSKVSPIFHEILHDAIYEVYKSHKLKRMRIFYYPIDDLVSITNIKILYEMGAIFILTDYVDTKNFYSSDGNSFDIDKSSIMEFFSQTGKYNKIDGKYSWSQGIYNIINRPMEESDEYYNIVFHLAIPEDRTLVEDIVKIMDGGATHHKDVVRIKTVDGKLKYIEVNLYSNFDEEGNLVSHHGVMNDITYYSRNHITKPVDLLLNGFKNSKKLALLIEPLNPTQYEFSEGFYRIVETDPEEYLHSQKIVQNIVEKDVVDELIKIDEGKLNEVDVTFTYRIGDIEKICELYIERFEFGDESHSIGFLTDISEERRKQEELINANEHQKVLIKEVHHRVKNNLQILNSFLNLEKRVYEQNPEIIINHMQSRLTSLAILHEKTYNTTDFKNINLNDFIKDQDAQFKTLMDSNGEIEFISKIDSSMNLSIEIITPLLLIINEITMNSIKHAFTDEMHDKRIIKEVTKIDDNAAKLIIMDNGVGIDDASAVVNNLGCVIIKSLVGQLDGKIKLLSLDKGTGYELIFPLTMNHTITQ